MTRKLTTHEKSPLDDGTILMWGTEPMVIPEGGKHARVCSLFLSPLPKNNAVTATVFSTDSNGTMFAIWSIKKIYEKDYTQIAFHAANVQIGLPSDFEYFIEWQVMAKAAGK